MNLLARNIPSMFHRRLLLLALIVFGVGVLLVSQLVRLTVCRGLKYHIEAERVLSSSRLIPTIRGSVFDCKGRVLASDESCWDIAVDYDLLTGAWAYAQAKNDARGVVSRKGDRKWSDMTVDEREYLVGQCLPIYSTKNDELWAQLSKVCDIDREDLEHRKQEIADRIHRIRASHIARRARQRDRDSDDDIPYRKVAQHVREENQWHTLIHAVSDEVALAFRKRQADFHGLHLVRSTTRVYPLSEKVVGVDLSTFPPPLREAAVRKVKVKRLCGIIVGTMRKVYAEDLDEQKGGRPYRRNDGSIDFGGYRVDDRRGSRGIEMAQELTLRGTRGSEVRHRDTGQREVIEPRPGHDVRLTIDARLQSYIRAIMDPAVGLMRVQGWHSNKKMPLGKELNGVAVVLEVDTGNVLAMVSTPALSGDDDNSWPVDRDHPGLNRVTNSIYPPGSLLKPIIYTIAARAGVIGVDQVVVCKGYLDEGHPNRYRCWGWRPDEGKFLTHGPVDPVKAIAASCNIFFYTCGRALGVRRIVDGLHDFGIGYKSNLGLSDELPGLMPRIEGPNSPGRGLTRQNATLMGIGQGPIAVTPLQIVNAHATLARGGFYMPPTILLTENNDNIVKGRDLNISSRIINNVLKGMYESANNVEYGTGQRITYGNGIREKTLTLKGPVYRGKTGTAQANTDFDDANSNGRIDPGETVYRRGEHAWYICHIQKQGDDHARYIVLVVVEYGGSGGRVAGPIVNQIIYAMQAEGYL